MTMTIKDIHEQVLEGLWEILPKTSKKNIKINFDYAISFESDDKDYVSSTQTYQKIEIFINNLSRAITKKEKQKIIDLFLNLHIYPKEMIITKNKPTNSSTQILERKANNEYDYKTHLTFFESISYDKEVQNKLYPKKFFIRNTASLFEVRTINSFIESLEKDYNMDLTHIKINADTDYYFRIIQGRLFELGRIYDQLVKRFHIGKKTNVYLQGPDIIICENEQKIKKVDDSYFPTPFNIIYRDYKDNEVCRIYAIENYTLSKSTFNSAFDNILKDSAFAKFELNKGYEQGGGMDSARCCNYTEFSQGMSVYATIKTKNIVDLRVTTGRINQLYRAFTEGYESEEEKSYAKY